MGAPPAEAGGWPWAPEGEGAAAMVAGTEAEGVEEIGEEGRQPEEEEEEEGKGRAEEEEVGKGREEEEKEGAGVAAAGGAEKDAVEGARAQGVAVGVVCSCKRQVEDWPERRWSCRPWPQGGRWRRRWSGRPGCGGSCCPRSCTRRGCPPARSTRCCRSGRAMRRTPSCTSLRRPGPRWSRTAAARPPRMSHSRPRRGRRGWPSAAAAAGRRCRCTGLRRLASGTHTGCWSSPRR